VKKITKICGKELNCDSCPFLLKEMYARMGKEKFERWLEMSNLDKTFRLNSLVKK
jgi:hypothetical protein